MKKIKFLLVLLVLSTSLSASGWFTLTYSSYREGNSSWSEWTPLSPQLQMFMDSDRGRITIYSKKIQILDFVHLEEEEFQDGKTLSGWATDSEYKKVFIVITSMKDGSEFFSVFYPNFGYTYFVGK